MTDPITPERVTLTEAERKALFDTAWAQFARMPSSNPSDYIHHVSPTVERILSDRLRAAGERERALRARADEWEETCLGTICNSCGADNFSGASKFADSLRALLDGDEETTT